MPDGQEIRFDRAGKPIRVPPRFEGTYEQFADLVDKLEPHHCSFPNGHTLDKSSKCPCRRSKIAHDACEVHGKTKARKGLRYAKYLEKNLASRMAEAHVDPDLLSVGHDVDLFSVRLSQLMERLDTGESKDAWRALGVLWSKLMEAQREQAEAIKQREQAEADGNEAEFRSLSAVIAKWSGVASSAIREIGKTITGGLQNESAWDEALELSERVAKLKAVETVRRKEAGLTLNVEQALSFVQQLSDIVTQEVEDKNVRATIALRFATVIGISASTSTAPMDGFLITEGQAKKETEVTRKVPTVEELIAKHVE